MHVDAERRMEKLEEETVREHLRSAEGAGHAQRYIVAHTPDLNDPVGRWFCCHALHSGEIQRSELRDIFALHGLNDGGRKSSTKEDAAVLMHGDTRPAVVVGGKFPP